MLFGLAGSSTLLQAQVIPPNRLTDWTPGVRAGVIGGIPSNRTNLIDVTKPPYNADKTGTLDVTSVIQSAINASSVGDVIYLPAGIYRISSALHIDANETIVPFVAMEWMRRLLIVERRTLGFSWELQVTITGHYPATWKQHYGGLAKGQYQL